MKDIEDKFRKVSVEEDICQSAHRHSIRNEAEIRSSGGCGCFYCGSMFVPNQIVHWEYEHGDSEADPRTAFCPRCDCDAVIGDSSGIAINKAFLDKMSEYAF